MTHLRAHFRPESQANLRRNSFALAFLFAFLLTPAFAATTCEVRALGAQTDDTAALQQAIDRCAQGLGGTVHLGAGTYLSRPLTLRSHIHLQLDAGAMLLGSPHLADYPLRADATWRRVSLLHADHVTDLTISGAGTVDGNGKVWWDAKAATPKGTPENPRPLLIDLTNSQQILIEGVTVQNSPQYNIAAFWCDNLTIRNIIILNPGRGAPNTDGIDPVASSHVLIEHDTIDTGDDNVAIKSGLVGLSCQGRQCVGLPNPATDITVRDCTFLNGHGLSIGSETAGGVNHVTVERITFTGTRQGIRIKSARGRGNDIDYLTYRDITMTGVETPIEITAYYTGFIKDDPGQPMTTHTPRLHDITIENLTASEAKRAAAIQGLPESPIKNLILRNVSISAATGMFIANAQAVFDHVTITPATGEPITQGPRVSLT